MTAFTFYRTIVVIGAFLRAHRMCSPEFLSDEIENIKKSFKKLKYPEYFILNCKRKATKTFFGKKPQNPEVKAPNRIIFLPTNNKTTSLNQSFNPHKYQIVTTTSRTIREIVRPKRPKPAEEAGLYMVPCQICPAVYLGETARSLPARLREHKADLRKDNPLNAIAQHRKLKYNHPIDFSKAKLIKPEKDKHRRRCIEAAAIQQYKNTMDQRSGFVKISPHLSDLILKQNRIKI